MSSSNPLHPRDPIASYTRSKTNAQTPAESQAGPSSSSLSSLPTPADPTTGDNILQWDAESHASCAGWERTVEFRALRDTLALFPRPDMEENNLQQTFAAAARKLA